MIRWAWIALLALAPQLVSAQGRGLAVARADAPVSEQRVALVIGNADYASSPLKNPVNDAQDISAKLKALGFDVVERRNLATRQIGSTLREFRSRLRPGAVALVFYAGHGLQIKGDNYLPAVDAEISSEEDVPNQSLAVRQIMDVLEDAKTRVNLVFLDACRNNPYARSFRSAGDGLARMNAPSGTLISFATRPGSVASDGSGRNGLYTEQLLRQMDEANVPIEQVLKRVLSGVKSTSKGKQEPWMEGSLEGDFYFRFREGAGTQVASLTPVPTAPTGGGLSLDDIRKQQETRAQWDKWQAQMQADFDKVAALDAAPDLQTAAWDRFLAAYTQKNPLGDRDEQLRSEARSHKAKAEADKQRRAAQPVTPVASGQAIKDCPDCPEMVVIPAGSFAMGSPDSEQGRFDNEGPQHRVNIASFALGKYAVTFAEWDACVAAGGCTHKPSDEGWGRGNRPVININWHDAREYVLWLKRQTGKSYRLPSEAEWEYAARAGTATSRYWGDGLAQACGYANAHDETSRVNNKLSRESLSCDDGHANTAPVGSFKPNAFGLHDMLGNVLQWVDDCLHDDYKGAPDDGSAWLGGECKDRMLRGGSWASGGRTVRSAARLTSKEVFPGRKDSTARHNFVGVRLARTLP
jgi:formylglycine-generating enzyme required for sulfatase activity